MFSLFWLPRNSCWISEAFKRWESISISGSQLYKLGSLRSGLALIFLWQALASIPGELTKGQGFPFSYAFQPFLTYIPFFHCVSTRWCFAAGCQYVPVTWVQQGEDFQTRLALNLVVGEILTGHRTRITFSSKWRDKRCPSWNRCGLLSTCPWTVAQTDIRASCWRWSTACMDPRIEQISLQWCLK